MSGNGDHSELIALLELLCEDRISPAQLDRLETLVRTDHGAMSVYLEYIDLHGTLHWDTARSGSGDMDASCKTGIARRPDGAGEPVRPAATAARSAKRVARRSRWLLPALAVACLTIAFSIIAINRGPNIDSVDPRAPLIARQNEPDGGTLSGDPGRTVPKSHYAPVELNPIVPRDGQAAADLEDLPPPAARAAHSVAAVPAELSIDAVVAVINERVRARWQENEIEPSPWADDLEWLRRVSLDIVGHIPSVEATRQFQADTTASERPSAETGSDAAKDVPEVDEAVAFRSSVAVPDKRRQMVETLLDDVDYVRNWSTIWTNQLIGRGESRDVNRVALEKHLRDVFARNVSWDRIVRDFVAAEGTPAENGASAFLLAHLNNQAVPATAITARTFLCVQVQCTQCHNHPFNDWKQDQFWSLNSFFKQTRRQRVVRPDGTGRNDSPEFELVSLHVGGPTYYAKRNQEMAAAYPVFDGVSIRPDATVDRRTALAKLLTDGRRPQIADAMGVGALFRLWIDKPHRRHGPAQSTDRWRTSGFSLTFVCAFRLRCEAAHPLDLRFRRLSAQ